MNKLEERIEYIKESCKNQDWDCRGAKPIDETAINNCLKLNNVCDNFYDKFGVFPDVDGGIYLMYKKDAEKILLDIALHPDDTYSWFVETLDIFYGEKTEVFDAEKINNEIVKKYLN